MTTTASTFALIWNPNEVAETLWDFLPDDYKLNFATTKCGFVSTNFWDIELFYPDFGDGKEEATTLTTDLLSMFSFILDDKGPRRHDIREEIYEWMVGTDVRFFETMADAKAEIKATRKDERTHGFSCEPCLIVEV